MSGKLVITCDTKGCHAKITFNDQSKRKTLAQVEKCSKEGWRFNCGDEFDDLSIDRCPTCNKPTGES